MSSEILAQLAAAIGSWPGAGGRPQPDAPAVDPGDPVAAGVRAVQPVPDRGDLALRSARAGLVLEQYFAVASIPGTHFDAPAHWVTGKDYADGFTDTLPVQRFLAPACVIDCSKEAAADERFVMEPAHIEALEARHGRIPKGAWVLMRTDWSKRTEPAAFLNIKEDGPHVPGPSAAAVRFLIEGRDVNGWGVEAVGTDHGQAFAFEPAFPAHHLMHGAGKLGLASLVQPRPAAADGRAPDHPAAQDREGLGQPVARAGAGAGLSGVLAPVSG